MKHTFRNIVLPILCILIGFIFIGIKMPNIIIWFTGGLVSEIVYDQKVPHIDSLQEVFSQTDYFGSIESRGEKILIMYTRYLTEKELQDLVQALSIDNQGARLNNFKVILPIYKKFR